MQKTAGGTLVERKIRAYFEVHPEANNQEVTEALGVSQPMVSKVRTQLKAARAASPVVNVDDIVHQVEEDRGRPLTAEERRQVLSSIARSTTAQSQSQIQAIWRLEQMEERQGEKALGPPPPLTDAEKIHDLGELMEALGEKVTRAAWRITFAQKGEKPKLLPSVETKRNRAIRTHYEEKDAVTEGRIDEDGQILEPEGLIEGADVIVPVPDQIVPNAVDGVTVSPKEKPLTDIETES